QPGAESAADHAGSETPPLDFHLGLMTGTGSQSLEELRGAMEILRLYGDVDQGGAVRHVTYPDNFMTDIETTISRILELADDPLMKVIVVNQAVPGTAEAFRRIKSTRPELILIAGESQEDMNLIASAADLVVTSDFISRGYLIPYAARKLGAKTFMHISFPRHMIDESMARRRAIMEQACNDLGIRFVFENVPDPMGDLGVEGARQYIEKKFPEWIARYGPETVFFCTNDAQTEPLIRQIAAHGGFFVEADLPSPRLGYPEALNINLTGDPADGAAILKKVEEAVVKAGAGGRMGTWAYSFGYCQTAGLAEFGKLVAQGRAGLSDSRALLACYSRFSPGASWNGRPYTDVQQRTRIDNYFLVYQDTYIFGRGYLGVAGIEVPEKYRDLQINTARKAEPPAFHIGIATGSTVQGADDLQGALEIIRLYGDVDQGGMIRHVIYPDNFMDETEETISLIAGLAEDPLMKVIVVNQAIPGTTEAFRRIKARRPDILCLAGEAHEDPDVIASIADLVVTSDFISRGYLIPYSARILGARTFVHISFPRHMAYETMGRRKAIMEQACLDLGLNFAYEEAPDPTGPAGTEGARKFIMDHFPAWIKKYGRETAFFCTNDAHTEPLIRQIAYQGGYFIEADIPSPLLGYPEAFGLTLQDNSGGWGQVLKKIEQAATAAGADGRLGTWAHPLGFCQTAGMAEFGKLVAEGRARLSGTQTLLDCYGKFSPGAKWNGTYYMDAVTSKPIRNYFLIYQDTYVFGRGYMGATSVEIPEKYLLIDKDHEIQSGSKK
ncbi:MAG: DUF3798 domain-containing protein, partial [Candidatus Adiutrix sp.]|nr:DUF3798 domain-containing protein [Candidatus Adiutrix sp.]